MLEESLAIPASDLWALGCIIYRMHTGRVPFEGPSEIATFDKILTRDIKWPENMDSDTRDVIDKLL
jgi:3-phosphoinositide dependent protein kinase-1